MIRAIAQVAINGLAVFFAAWFIQGISYDYERGVLYLLLTGLLIGAINLLVKPLVTLLSLPMIVLSLGLFYLAINGAMLLLAARLLDGLTIDGCLPAILGGLVLAVFNWVLRIFKSE